MKKFLNLTFTFCICYLLCFCMVSCFVTARNAYLETPIVKAAADTITSAIGKTYKDYVKPLSDNYGN